MEIEDVQPLRLFQLSNSTPRCTDSAVTFVSPRRQVNIQQKHYLQKPVLIPLRLTKLFIPKPTLIHNVTDTYSIIVIPQVYLLY